ncbi:hypothetical protein B0G80_9177 [Paraburkholderia sp. BL6669N2]|nr:hypothetical protein B0G80_9177 [Paraburkholderia sp. BL6669N2]
MGLLLEGEADCLNHQHNHRRHWPPIRRQSRAAAPYRASGLVQSAFADIGVAWVLRQQCGGLLTVAASSSRTAASCISELTLPTHCCRWGRRSQKGWLLDGNGHSILSVGNKSLAGATGGPPLP